MDDHPEGETANATISKSAAVELMGIVMIAFVIVLFAAIVLTSILRLYARWFWQDSPPANTTRRRRRRRFVFVVSQDYSTTTLQRGLQASVLRSLPVVEFRPEEFKDGLECAVCLSEVVQGEKARILPKCSHGFHVECIDMWFQSHSTCPLCRSPVDFEDKNLEGNAGSSQENLVNENSLEYPNTPTNVLFWGNETQIGPRNSDLETVVSSHSSHSTASTSGGCSNRPDGMLMIDIPRRTSENSIFSPSARRSCIEEEARSPITSRIRSCGRSSRPDGMLVIDTPRRTGENSIFSPSARRSCIEEEARSPITSRLRSCTGSSRPDGMLVIDIPRRTSESSIFSPWTRRSCAEGEAKSPMTTRLRSLTRLLSREKRSNPCSPGSIDFEQDRRGHEFHENLPV